MRQAAHRVATEEIATYWDVVFAPTFVDGQVAGFVDIVTDATERVRTYEKLENRVAAFTAIADAMTLEHPLTLTLRQVARSVRTATACEAAAVVVWDDGDLRDLAAYGDDGLPEGYREAVEAAYALGVDSPIRAVTTQTEVTVIRGFRGTAEADPCYAPLHPLWRGHGVPGHRRRAAGRSRSLRRLPAAVRRVRSRARRRRAGLRPGRRRPGGRRGGELPTLR